ARVSRKPDAREWSLDWRSLDSFPRVLGGLVVPGASCRTYGSIFHWQEYRPSRQRISARFWVLFGTLRGCGQHGRVGAVDDPYHQAAGLPLILGTAGRQEYGPDRKPDREESAVRR